MRTDTKRDAILEVARQAFLEMGYERTSMAEISARLGGSKATLYGYFPSKQELFVTITNRLAQQYMASARARLKESTDEAPGLVLQHFGEQLLAFLCTPGATESLRMVQSEAANSDIGRSFYEQGPARAIAELSSYISGAMGRGQLRRADATVAAQHLLGLLLHGEYASHFLIPDLPKPTRAQIKRFVKHALDVFLGGYKA